MIKSLKSLYFLLTKEQRRTLLRLQVLIVIMAVAQVASVLSIGPFMAVVGDIGRLESNGLIADLYHASGLTSAYDFLFWLGISVLMVLVISAIISIYTSWRLCRYGARIGVDISSRLFSYYMKQPWLFHVSGSSSSLTKQIAQECQRVNAGIIRPLMDVNAKLVMSLMMAITLILYNPSIALLGILIFSFSYCFLFFTVRRSLIVNGRKISKIQGERYKTMYEGFGGIKDALVLGRENSFIIKFKRTCEEYAHAFGTIQILSQVPRYVMELIAFGAIIFLVLYLLSSYRGDLGLLLPTLSVYALAGFKLLPAFQQIYQGVSSVRSNIAAFEAIRGDLQSSAEDVDKSQSDEWHDASQRPETTASLMSVDKGVCFQNVAFHYPGHEEPVLNDLSFDIPVNRVVGLVGASGSGKSTAVDLLLGLIDPDHGHVLVDGVPLSMLDSASWKQSVGYVPQSIFLADASIRENIAFGLPTDSIDEEKVARASHLAYLGELLDSLPQGLSTRVGERGIQLSGGQRQRIGIARALYDDAPLLVLDEATSALDGITEKKVMNAIHDISGDKTIIIIAHRLATVRQCDLIYLIDQGRVIDKGKYDDLASRNETFKKMASQV